MSYGMMVTGDVMCKERKCPQITGNDIIAKGVRLGE